jgi:hypothetical protein
MKSEAQWLGPFRATVARAFQPFGRNAPLSSQPEGMRISLAANPRSVDQKIVSRRIAPKVWDKRPKLIRKT